MATAKKPAVKAKIKPVAAKKAPVKAKAPVARKTASEPVKTYAMPQDVKDWIERANSIMNHQRGEIERLKTENKDLRTWRRWAEDRILKSDHE